MNDAKKGNTEEQVWLCLWRVGRLSATVTSSACLPSAMETKVPA